MASHSQGCHCSDCGRDDISHSLAGQVNPHTRGSSSPPSLFSLPTTTAIGLLAHRELRFLSLPPDCDPIAGIPFPYSQARHNPSAIYESVLATAAHPHVPLAPLPPDGGAGYQKPFIPGCLESTRAAARRAKEAKKRTATTCAQGSIPLDLDDSLDEGLPPTRTTEISTQSSMAGATDTTNLSRQDGGHKQSSAGARRHQGVWNEVNPVSGVFFVGHTEGALQSAPTSVPMPPSDPRTPAYRRGGLTSRQSALLDGGCSVEPSFLTQYGLDRIPPLPTAPTASRRHAFRPVSALARQRMIYCDQVSSRPLMYRVPTVSYGTDVPPPLIVPHLWNIHTRKSHRPWVEYHRKRESVEETSRKRKAIEQEMISKIDTRASAYVKEETVATEASTADTSRASKHSARCQSRLAAYLQHDGCSTKQPPQKSTRQVSVSAKRYERIKGMDSDDSGAVSAPKLSSASQKPAARIEKVAGPAPVPDASLQEDAKDSKYSLSTTEDLTTEQYREQRISRPPAATQGRNPSPSPSKEAKRSQNPASLFPRQVFPHGREGSKPPPFQPGEAEFLRPRFQPPRFAGDLYTPATVRAGKSAGQGPAAGDIGSKEGWCGLCPPASAESITTGAHKVQMGGWLNLRNSSYRYHLIRAHGISPKTFVPYQEPVETVKRDAEMEERVAEGSELRGRCHQCEAWIIFGFNDATNFYVHASKCHRETPVGVSSQPASQEAADTTSVSGPVSHATVPATARRALVETSSNTPRSGPSSSLTSTAAAKGKLKRTRQVEVASDNGAAESVGSSRKTRSETGSQRPRISRKVI